MPHRRLRVMTAVLTAVILGSALASGAAAHDGRSVLQDLVRAAIATVRFHSTEQAGRAGFAPFPDGVPLHECISSLDDTGAMGFHWLNGGNLSTDLDVTKPQVLVYAPDRNGSLHLVALEYVVFQDDWFKANGDTTPMLFGQMFMKTGDRLHPEIPNRYLIPPFWSLHVWLWKWNPSGLFAPFNPRVSCDPGKHGEASRAGIGSLVADRVAVRAASRVAFDCSIRAA